MLKISCTCGTFQAFPKMPKVLSSWRAHHRSEQLPVNTSWACDQQHSPCTSIYGNWLRGKQLLVVYRHQQSLNQSWPPPTAWESQSDRLCQRSACNSCSSCPFSAVMLCATKSWSLKRLAKDLAVAKGQELANSEENMSCGPGPVQPSRVRLMVGDLNGYDNRKFNYS